MTHVSKRLKAVLSILAVLMVLCTIRPAFGATKPWITRDSYRDADTYLNVGQVCTLKFKVHSGSYTKTNECRARFDTDMFDAHNNRVDYTKYKRFTGDKTMNIKYTFYAETYRKGATYYLRPRVQYRTSTQNKNWITSDSYRMKFYVR